MKVLPWILVVLLTALSGCATPKNTDRNVQVDYSNDLQHIQNRMDSLLFNMMLMQKETSERLSNLKIENTTTYLSAPDSTGKQYPTAISNTTANKEEKENKTIDTKIEADMKQLITKVSELKQRLDSAILEKEKVEEISWWQLHKVDMYVMLLAVLIGLSVYKNMKK